MAAIGSSGGGNNSSSDSSNDSRLNIRQRWSRRTMGVLRDQSSEDGHDRPDFGEEAVLAVSSNARFIAVANNDNDSNNSKHAAVYDCNSGMDVIWSTLARGESCFDEDEIVTSMAFMTVYSPPSPASKFLANDADVPQIVLLCGYSSGLMRVFSAENGDLLLSADLQPKPSTPSASQPHDHSVRAIRYYYSRRHDGSDLEHDMVTALIGDSGNVVCIDGHTLWVALRLGLSGSPPELDQETHLTIDRHVTISHFQLSSSSHQHHSRNKRQQTVLDCAVVDLIRPAGLHPLSKLPLNSLHSTNSSRLRKTAECDRTYIAAGSHPSLAVYMHADSRNVWNARAALARTAKRVTSAVVSTASSYLPNRAMYYLPRRLKQVAASPPPASSNQETLESPYASPIQRTSVFADSGRHISRLLILPQLAADSEQQFAVTSDNLGRVLLIDVRDGLVVRIWKGLRDAEVSYVYHSHALYIVIYAPRRNLVEIWPLTGHERTDAFQVSAGKWTLLQVPPSSTSIGSSLNPQQDPVGNDLATCTMLISSEGEIVVIKPPLSPHLPQSPSLSPSPYLSPSLSTSPSPSISI